MGGDRPIKLRPSFRRSIFNPRRPPQPHKSLDSLYAPLLPTPPAPSSAANHDTLTSRIYVVPSNEINRLQSQARKSKIESFNAFIWKTIAAGAGADVDPSKTVKLGVVVDGRARLSNETTSLECYFGNVLSVPYVEASVAELRATPLDAAADAVHECVATASSAEHFLALIYWVDVRRPKPAVVKVYCKDENDEAEGGCVVGAEVSGAEAGFWVGPTGFRIVSFPMGRGNGIRYAGA